MEVVFFFFFSFPFFFFPLRSPSFTASLSTLTISVEPYDEVPVPPEAEMHGRLKAIRAKTPHAWKVDANAVLGTYGFPKLHLMKERDERAYYNCSCDKSCSKVTLERGDWNGTKKGKSWKATSIGARKDGCLPVEPSGAALAGMFIPEAIKLQLIQSFDADLNVADAYSLSTTMARDLKLPLTWDQASVKNFFDRLTRAKDDELLAVLCALGEQDHCVILDIKSLPSGDKLLERFFFASSTMQSLFKLFGKDICTLDSTYG